MKKEVKETLTSLNLLIRTLDRMPTADDLLLLLGSFLSYLLRRFLGDFLRCFLLGGHSITSLQVLKIYLVRNVTGCCRIAIRARGYWAACDPDSGEGLAAALVSRLLLLVERLLNRVLAIQFILHLLD